jgi:hypothetical protein
MKNNKNDRILNVVEIFKSIQGEGANAGGLQSLYVLPVAIRHVGIVIPIGVKAVK